MDVRALDPTPVRYRIFHVSRLISSVLAVSSQDLLLSASLPANGAPPRGFRGGARCADHTAFAEQTTFTLTTLSSGQEVWVPSGKGPRPERPTLQLTPRLPDVLLLPLALPLPSTPAPSAMGDVLSCCCCCPWL